LKDEKLRLEMNPPGPTGDLRHQGGGVFALESVPNGVQLRFSDEKTRAQKLKLLMAGMEWQGDRVDGAK
jgi:hypothetical protein